MKPPALPARQARHRALDLLRREEEVTQVTDDMALDAAHSDHLASLTDVLEHAPGVVEHVVELLVVRHLELRARGHSSLLRCQLSEQQANQRRLAAAVPAQDADPIAAQDRRRQVAHDRGVTEGISDALAAQHLPTRAVGLLEGGLHASQIFAARAALEAQRIERAYPALVARAPRLDALP